MTAGQGALFDLPPLESDLHFYLGTPEPSWLKRAVRLPLFVSHTRLTRLRALPSATCGWALDSGGFSEIDRFGRWTISSRDYIAAVARYDREIRCLEWAAPQDWMCEPQMLAKTGLTAAEHQRRTVANFVELRALWPEFSDETCPIMPVLQGDPTGPPDGPTSHRACIKLYADHGIDLAGDLHGNVEGDGLLIGLGSVCRQENTDRIGAVIRSVLDVLPAAQLHGFGVKAGGLRRYGHLLASADSQAWSRGARHRTRQVRSPRCPHAGPCSWCPRFAMEWREGVRAAAGRPRDTARFVEHFPSMVEFLEAGGYAHESPCHSVGGDTATSM